MFFLFFGHLMAIYSRVVYFFVESKMAKRRSSAIILEIPMAYDETLAEEVRRLLPRSLLVEKKMFGGLGFMLNGNMCVAVNNQPDHIMMVRIDPTNHEAFKKKGAKIAVMRGKEMPGWIFLTKEAIETEEDFEYWINLALDFNKKLPAKKK